MAKAEELGRALFERSELRSPLLWPQTEGEPLGQLTGAPFSLVTFFWVRKRKLPAVGCPRQTSDTTHADRHLSLDPLHQIHYNRVSSKLTAVLRKFLND